MDSSHNWSKPKRIVLKRKKTSDSAVTPSPSSSRKVKQRDTAVSSDAHQVAADNGLEASRTQDDDGGGNHGDDLMIRSSVSFTSDKSFDWCCPKSSLDIANGISRLTGLQKTPSSKLSSYHDEEAGNTDGDATIEVSSHCFTWCYPQLPLLNLFPRIVPDIKISKLPSNYLTSDMKKKLFLEWMDCLHCLYNLLKSGACDEFYVCAHALTICFRKRSPPTTPGDPDSDKPREPSPSKAPPTTINVMITPTTRGFRDSLANHDIQFSMPLYKKVDGALLSQDKLADNEGGKYEEDEDDIINTDDGAHSWLTELGLDKGNFKSLAPQKVKLDRSQTLNIDNRPKSLILIEEQASIIGLLNYLTNNKSTSIMATTGVQCGIPPTLLSPVAFPSAYLHHVKANSHTIKDSLTMTTKHTLRLTAGPILPKAYAAICAVLDRHDHQYKVNSSSVESSETFNEVMNSMK